jgi:DNA-binding NtrC family response regulator
MVPQVLFVDDDPLLLQGIVRSLAREPYKLHCAPDADAALNIMRSEPIDILVSDDQMPGMPGNELVAQVHQEFPLVLSILLTGQATVGSLVHALNHGHVFRVLLKPCRADEIAGTIRRALVHRAIWNRCREALPLLRDLGDLLDVVDRTAPAHTRNPALTKEGDHLDLDDLAAALDAGIERAREVLSRARV